MTWIQQKHIVSHTEAQTLIYEFHYHDDIKTHKLRIDFTY